MNKKPTFNELITQKQYALLEKASDSEARLERIVSSISSVVFETDEKGRWTFLNDSWPDITGYSVAESLCNDFVDSIYFKDRKKNLTLLQTLLGKNKTAHRHRTRFKHKKDGFVWVEISTSLTLDSNNHIVGAAGTINDIHKQVLQREQMLRRENILEATNIASNKLVGSDLDYQKENEILTIIARAAQLKQALFFDVSLVSDEVLVENARVLSEIPKVMSFAKLSHEQVVNGYPGLTSVVLTRAIENGSLVLQNHRSKNGRIFQHLLLPIVEGNTIRKAMILIGEDHWNQYDINVLKIFSQKLGLTLERSSAIAAQVEGEKRFRYAIEGVNEGVWDWNVKTGEAYFSARWTQMLGYEQDELKGNLSTWSSLVHPDDLEKVSKVLNAHLQGETEFYESTFRAKHKSGNWIWILARGKVVQRDSDGAPERATGTHQDITEKIFIEEKLAQRTSELAVANQEIDAVMLISPVGFLVFNTEGNSSFFTPCFASLMSVDDSILGLSFVEAKEKIISLHHVVTNHRLQKSVGEITIENKINHKFIKLNFANPDLLNALDSPDLISAIDITEEYNLDKMKSYFMSAASHELRTPLSSICGFSELLMESRNDFSLSEQEQMIKSIYTQSNSLASIVSQLLDVARIDSGREIKITPVQINLAKFMSQIIQQFHALENTHDIQLASEDNCTIMADEELLSRIFNNLLSNACKYSAPKSKILVNIRHVVFDEQKTVLTEITDEGIGMDKKDLDNVFERFFRAEYDGKIQGMGLGLSIVKELVESHAGTIKLTSKKGEGTTASIWLPAVDK